MVHGEVSGLAIVHGTNLNWNFLIWKTTAKDPEGKFRLLLTWKDTMMNLH